MDRCRLSGHVARTQRTAINPDDLMPDTKQARDMSSGGELSLGRTLTIIDGDRIFRPLPVRQRNRVHTARKQYRFHRSAHTAW